jgi:tRNA A22 N-methylase
MGGQTISDIIKSKQYDGRYIIHSTTSLPLVRKTIQEIGMKIVNEYLVIEGKIYNILIEVIPGDMELTDKELYMGPSLINNNDDEVIKYYRFLLDVLEDNATMSGNDQLKLQERT